MVNATGTVDLDSMVLEAPAEGDFAPRIDPVSSDFCDPGWVGAEAAVLPVTSPDVFEGPVLPPEALAALPLVVFAASIAVIAFAVVACEGDVLEGATMSVGLTEAGGEADFVARGSVVPLVTPPEFVVLLAALSEGGAAMEGEALLGVKGLGLLVWAEDWEVVSAPAEEEDRLRFFFLREAAAAEAAEAEEEAAPEAATPPRTRPTST